MKRHSSGMLRSTREEEARTGVTGVCGERRKWSPAGLEITEAAGQARPGGGGGGGGGALPQCTIQAGHTEGALGSPQRSTDKVKPAGRSWSTQDD